MGKPLFILNPWPCRRGYKRITHLGTNHAPQMAGSTPDKVPDRNKRKIAPRLPSHGFRTFDARLSARCNTSLHTAAAECGRPRAFGALAMPASFPEPRSCSRRKGRSSKRLAFVAAPCSRRKTLLAASWPGMGFRMNRGRPGGERLDGGEAAGLGDDEVGDGHQFVHVCGETEDVRGVLAIVDGEFAPELFVATGDDDGLELAGDLVKLMQNFRDRAHAETAAEDEQNRLVIAQAVMFADRLGIRLGEKLLRRWGCPWAPRFPPSAPRATRAGPWCLPWRRSRGPRIHPSSNAWRFEIRVRC